MVVAPPGAQLIELFPQSFVVPVFLELTSRLGIGYQYLVGSTPRASSSSSPTASSRSCPRAASASAP